MCSIDLDANQLPIQPEITPALGVAGVILIVLGLAYTFVGIKNQWYDFIMNIADVLTFEQIKNTKSRAIGFMYSCLRHF